jgi:hypothetical protein
MPLAIAPNPPRSAAPRRNKGHAADHEAASGRAGHRHFFKAQWFFTPSRHVKCFYVLQATHLVFASEAKDAALAQDRGLDCFAAKSSASGAARPFGPRARKARPNRSLQ